MAAALLATAKVWHYWLSIAIIMPTLGVTALVIVGYLKKVVAPRYGRR